MILSGHTSRAITRAIADSAATARAFDALREPLILTWIAIILCAVACLSLLLRSSREPTGGYLSLRKGLDGR